MPCGDEALDNLILEKALKVDLIGGESVYGDAMCIITLANGDKIKSVSNLVNNYIRIDASGSVYVETLSIKEKVRGFLSGAKSLGPQSTPKVTSCSQAPMAD